MSLIKLNFISDLHLDFLRDNKGRLNEDMFEKYKELLLGKGHQFWMNDFESKDILNKYSSTKHSANYLIIAGDLIEAKKFKQIVGLMEEVCGYYDKIFYIFGNHEFYHSTLSEAYKKVQAEIDKSEILKNKLVVCENEKIMLRDNLQLILSTYWYNIRNPIEAEEIRGKMNDYRYIKKENYTRITPNDFLKKHQESKNFLIKTLKDTEEEVKTIVITHHATSLNVNKGTIFEEPKHALGYCSYLTEDVIDAIGKKSVSFIHGHTHVLKEKCYKNEWGYDTFINTIGYVDDEFKLQSQRNLCYLLLWKCILKINLEIKVKEKQWRIKKKTTI